MNEHATPRSLYSEESERGSRSSGCLVVVVVSLFALSRLLRGAKKHQLAVDFRVLATSHVPARIPIAGPVCALGRVAQPAFGRRIFTSVIRNSRLAAVVCRVAPRKKVRFLPGDCAPSLFLIPLAVPSFPRQPGSVGRSPGSIRGLGIFVEFALASALRFNYYYYHSPNPAPWFAAKDGHGRGRPADVRMDIPVDADIQGSGRQRTRTRLGRGRAKVRADADAPRTRTRLGRGRASDADMPRTRTRLGRGRASDAGVPRTRTLSGHSR